MISFGLRGGEPLFSTGKLQVENRLPRGQIVLTLTGEAGFRYLVEKKRPPHNWFPLLVLTNMLGTTTFADPEANGGSTLNFYRSRILD